MTKKDFELIATIINHLPLADVLRRRITLEFARELRKTNPNFDEERFAAACFGIRKRGKKMEFPT